MAIMRRFAESSNYLALLLLPQISRAGAGLVLAGLVSDGITIVEDSSHIDRGYPHFAEQLQALGADVTRESVD